MITLNQSTKTEQNYVIWILTALTYIWYKTEDFYEGIANDFEEWFNTSNYDEDDKIPLPIGKNKKVIGLFKDELDERLSENLLHLEQNICILNGWWYWA